MGLRRKAFEAGGMWRRLVAAAIAGGLAAAPVSAQNQPPSRSAAPACETRRTEDRIASVTERGEVRLASGQTVKLSGLRLPEGETEAKAARSLLASFGDAPVAIGATASAPDRWGRLPAVVTVTTDAGPVDLNRALVAAGLALVDAGEADRLCQSALLAAEQRARDWGLGLWRLERYKPASADDLERLKALVGQFALIEGRVRSVGERQQRTYLNFGADWSTDLTVTIPKRTWQTMRDRGVTAAELRGRRVRARGMVEEWRGPAITIMVPEMLEILDGESPRRP
jgi:endonuclease YncB( thermonuclease family)